MGNTLLCDITRQDIEKWIKQAYNTACEHGFHDKEYSDKHWFMLIVTEIAEAVNADRKNKNADGFVLIAIWNYVFGNEHPDNAIFKRDFKEHIKDTVSDELADVCIRIFDFAGLKKYDVSNYTRFEKIPFPEDYEMPDFGYLLIEIMLDYRHDTIDRLTALLNAIFCYCNCHNIDLKRHIELKMKYNELREFKNGKNY